MTTEHTYAALCRLLAAWVNGVPAGEAPPDFGALYAAADRHFLSAAVCAALESTGLMDDCPPETASRFQTAKLAALRRTLLMDAERQAVLEALEEMGVWYAPLRGAVINAVYPQYGVRQFSDSDILFDADRWQDVRACMKRRGYTAESLGKGSHDTYHKPPVYNFELHRRLLSGDGQGGCLDACAAYYADTRERLIKDGDNGFGYHFSDEDFYVYFIAHAYKHYGGEGGTGLRTLLDVYLYRRSRPDMDGAYIDGELEKLGLGDFETVCRSLSEKLFGPPPVPALTEGEQKMLSWVESSGVYGTVEHFVQSGLQAVQGDGGPVSGAARAKYLLRRLFPDMAWYQVHAPFCFRHRWAIPPFWVYRLGRGVFVKGKRNFRALREIFRPAGGSGQ